MTNVTTVSVARAKQMLSDNKIDNKEAKTLGLNAKRASELTKALQGNKMNQQTALEQIMMYGHVEKAAAKQNDTFLGGLLRKAGFSGTAAFLEDKDKVCTDGKDDGKLSFKEGATSYLKGLVGGIPKTIINHPIATALTVAASAGILVATGGAAAPILWGVGATLAAGTTVAGAVKYAKADNDADAKAALEMSGTGTAGLILSGVTKNASMKAGKNAGVDTENGIVNTVKSSAQTSVKNAKANYTYLKTGVVTKNSNVARYNTSKNKLYSSRLSGDGKAQDVTFKAMPEGTKFEGANGIETLKPKHVILMDKDGNMSQVPLREVLNDYHSEDVDLTEIAKVYSSSKAEASYKARCVEDGSGTAADKEFILTYNKDNELLAAQNEFQNPQIKSDLATAAKNIEGESFANANRPNYHYKTPQFNAADIKEELIASKGIKLETIYDDYYGNTLEKVYYTYKGKTFPVDFKNQSYNETLDQIINDFYAGKLE